MRPSPGSQSTLMTPLLIFQSVALLVSMVICACAGEAVSNRDERYCREKEVFHWGASIFQ